MNIQNILDDKSFQISFTAAIVFLIAAFPPLFKNVDLFISNIFGTRIGKNYYSVLFIHAIIVGILMFLLTSYILKPVYNIMTRKNNNDVIADRIAPRKKERTKRLEKFSVGGSMTCGGK